MQRTATVFCLSVLLYGGVVSAAEKPVRAAIERALPYVVERGQWWIDEKGCVSCHRVGPMTWSLSRAAAAGFEVDRKQLAEWQRWSIESLFAKNEEKPDKLVADGNLEGLAQLVWSSGEKDGLDAKERLLFLDRIVAGQQEDGAWKPGGQLPGQKRPLPQTTLVSTAWMALALDGDDRDASQEALKQALERITANEDGKSSEWLALRLLLAVASKDEQSITKWRSRLLAAQQENGGWGWMVADEADALGTGHALFALRRTGTAPDDPAVVRATTFLVTTQNEDGRWSVPGTKRKAKGEPTETADYWGTCWAVIGLVEVAEPAK